MSQSEKYREVYELYQFCSNGKDLKEFCIDADVYFKTSVVIRNTTYEKMLHVFQKLIS